MNIATISNVSHSAGFEGTATVGQKASSPQSLANVLATSNSKTTVVTMADGATVTTTRDKAGEILSISTTPPTRPPEVSSAKATSGAAGGKVDLTA